MSIIRLHQEVVGLLGFLGFRGLRGLRAFRVLGFRSMKVEAFPLGLRDRDWDLVVENAL